MTGPTSRPGPHLDNLGVALLSRFAACDDRKALMWAVTAARRPTVVRLGVGHGRDSAREHLDADPAPAS